MQQFFNSLVQSVGNYVPRVLGAIIVLVVGWLVALGLKRLVEALLAKANVDSRLEKRMGAPQRVEYFLAGLVYYGVLIYVLIMTLATLGLEGVLDPLNMMFSRFVGAVPNILAALLLGILGYIIARICGNIVTALTAGADKLTTKTRLPGSFSPSKLLGQLVFIFIFVPALIAALEALGIEAIARPATDMLTALMVAIPQILAAALILIIAYIVGRFVAEFLGSLFHNLGADSLPAKVGMEDFFGKVSLSRAVAGVIFFFIMLAAAVSAAQAVGLPLLAVIVSNLLGFAANVALGLVILAVGAWIAQMAYVALMRSKAQGAVAEVTRAAILVLVLAMGLRAMGIAEDIVNLAFLLSLGAIAVAFALAFGLGGRDAAGRELEDWFKKLHQGKVNEPH